MAQAVAAKPRQQNRIFPLSRKLQIVTVTDDSAECLIQCPLMLQIPKPVDKNKIRISIYRYFTFQSIQFLITFFIQKCLFYLIQHGDSSVARFRLWRMDAEITPIFRMIIINQRMVYLY